MSIRTRFSVVFPDGSKLSEKLPKPHDGCESSLCGWLASYKTNSNNYKEETSYSTTLEGLCRDLLKNKETIKTLLEGKTIDASVINEHGKIGNLNFKKAADTFTKHPFRSIARTAFGTIAGLFAAGSALGLVYFGGVLVACITNNIIGEKSAETIITGMRDVFLSLPAVGALAGGVFGFLSSGSSSKINGEIKREPDNCITFTISQGNQDYPEGTKLILTSQIEPDIAPTQFTIGALAG